MAEQERPASDAAKAAAAERTIEKQDEQPTPAERQVRQLGAKEAHQRSA